MQQSLNMAPDTMVCSSLISVVVCTRNRCDFTVGIMRTILLNEYPDFEVILVDQSTNNDTANAIGQFLGDPRFQYIHSTTQGAGRARNIGLSQAQGDIVAFTDDDCTVPSNWLEVIMGIFATYPRVAMLFCNVDPAPYDGSVGFIPAYQRHDDLLVRTLWDKCRARGMGAGMAVRRDFILSIGKFDENLGPGAPFLACEEGDLAVRVLLNGGWVYETHQTSVTHYGFRTWHEGKQLTKRDWFGIGAAYAKPLKCGYWRVIIIVMYEMLVEALLKPLTKLLRLKKPQGLKQVFYFFQGFVKGLRTPVDCQHIIYRLP